MPGKEWTDEEVKKEIADAIAIVREDRFEAFVRNRTGQNSGDQNSGNDQSGNSGNGDKGNSGEGKKKGSLWWGDTE